MPWFTSIKVWVFNEFVASFCAHWILDKGFFQDQSNRPSKSKGREEYSCTGAFLKKAAIPFFDLFAVRATYHTTLQASPMQLVFGRDAILNIKHVSNWEHIRERKQLRINENNKRENKSRREHNYSLGDKILVKARKHSKHELEFDGPYEITQVNDNVTVRFQKGIVNDVVNIRRIKPFYE
jgi:hypothetical protein